MNEHQAIQIRGLILPSQFVSFIQSGSHRRDRGSWQLRDGRDAYKNRWETELGRIYDTIEQIQRESDLLPRYFAPDASDSSDGFNSEPGFIPYITDFAQILAFGIAGDGAPYCFDYREAKTEPTVIWWDDAYWRQVAPCFGTFITLFDFE